MPLDTLLKELGNLKLPEDSYVITASGPLAAHNIREAQDLDVVVTEELWKKLTKKYSVKKGAFETIDIGNIQILGEGSIYNTKDICSVKEQIATADIIKGHRFTNLPNVKKVKQVLGRPKDLKDIELIDNYLNSIQNT